MTKFIKDSSTLFQVTSELKIELFFSARWRFNFYVFDETLSQVCVVSKKVLAFVEISEKNGSRQASDSKAEGEKEIQQQLFPHGVFATLSQNSSQRQQTKEQKHIFFKSDVEKVKKLTLSKTLAHYDSF